ncbi:PrgI family mobile element protein [Paenibacillus chitinolyticus]|uniref:PrgI family mobile element protein n=1 Tax=Paenibacillus chitinolyticus TaxID=79263 RepID=UPI001C47A8D0|nr:PrgI family protein [Paenibacillus chitinolyticus]
MYLIPKNVGSRFEFFEGFGMKELIFCVLGALLGIGISSLLSLFIASLAAKIIPIAVCTAVAFFVVKEDPRLGKSVISTFKDQRKFLSKPRRYFYIFGEGRKR